MYTLDRSAAVEDMANLFLEKCDSGSIGHPWTQKFILCDKKTFKRVQIAGTTFL